MSAKRNNRSAGLLRLLPSKSLACEYIKSRDGDFFHKTGEKKIMEALDGSIDACRNKILDGSYGEKDITRDFLLGEIYSTLSGGFSEKTRSCLSLRRVINATGIILHTNLGRAPIGGMVDVETDGYCNLEFDIAAGTRGRRDVHFSASIAELTGAGDAIVVNNNAAAVLLIAETFLKGASVVVARGESVEIGEGFRVSEMFKIAGAAIRDAGATNSDSISDYESSIGDDTKMIARIHPSNYKISGFVKKTPDAEITALCRERGLISYFDAGSGLLSGKYVENSRLISAEPAVDELIKDGFDLVSFSGDKLFGSVQCGIICGKKDLIAALRKNQMYRAMRVSKTVIGLLQKTLAEYLYGAPAKNIPILGYLNRSQEEMSALRDEFIERAARAQARFAPGEGMKIFELVKLDACAPAGGGTTPQETLESPAAGLGLSPHSQSLVTLQDVSAFLRKAPEGIIGYIDGGFYILNFRAVTAAELNDICAAFEKMICALIENHP